MKYFRNNMSLQEVKTVYRKNAMKLHPDVDGGSVEAMTELNNEFEVAYKVAMSYEPNKTKESASEYKMQFYTQNGWCGSRYQSGLTSKDIAKIVREYVKYVYPTYKFSITSGGNCYCSEITIHLMEYPVELTNKELMTKYVNGYRPNDWLYIPSFKNSKLFCDTTENERMEAVEHLIERSTYEQLNDYYLDETTWINPIVLNVLIDVRNFVNSYNYDDSDSMTDYYDTNFYLHMEIGKWNKPSKLVEKTARISPTKVTKAKKLTA